MWMGSRIWQARKLHKSEWNIIASAKFSCEFKANEVHTPFKYLQIKHHFLGTQHHCPSLGSTKGVAAASISRVLMAVAWRQEFSSKNWDQTMEIWPGNMRSFASVPCMHMGIFSLIDMGIFVGDTTKLCVTNSCSCSGVCLPSKKWLRLKLWYKLWTPKSAISIKRWSTNGWVQHSHTSIRNSGVAASQPSSQQHPFHSQQMPRRSLWR